jgi:hypothetical protein
MTKGRTDMISVRPFSHFKAPYGSPRYSNIHSTSLGLKNALEGLK